MKITDLIGAIEFAKAQSEVQQQILKLESLPQRFAVKEIRVIITDFQKNIVAVLFNFNERDNLNASFKEDIAVTIQGTSLANFELLNIRAVEVK